MINPHGADELKPLYVEDDSARAQLQEDAGSLPAIVVSSAAAASATKVTLFPWTSLIHNERAFIKFLPV